MHQTQKRCGVLEEPNYVLRVNPSSVGVVTRLKYTTNRVGSKYRRITDTTCERDFQTHNRVKIA